MTRFALPASADVMPPGLQAVSGSLPFSALPLSPPLFLHFISRHFGGFLEVCSLIL